MADIKAKRNNKVRQGMSDNIFDAVNYFLVIIVMLATLYPLIYVFSMSISDPVRAAKNEVYLLPKGFSLYAYKTILSTNKIFMYYGNTIWYTVVGTILGIIVTVLAAYPLSRRNFKARTPITIFITMTMFFHAGLIPNYIVIVKFLNLYNSRWAIILPTLTSAWYVIVTRSFFQSLPEEVLDSAKVDGAGEFRILGSIVIPLSQSILAVLTVYFGISYWNSYFPALLYLGKDKLQPLSLYVRRVVIQSSMEDLDDLSAEALLSQLQLKYVVIVVAVVPLLALYPLFSKYMKKGLMVGSIKG